MSEIDTRPAPSRGRSSTRGGRSGIGRGGPRGGHRQANGATDDIPEPSFEDQGELGELKSQYSSQLSLLKDVFPDWSDVDLVMALQETDGDLPTTIDRITEGMSTESSAIRTSPPAQICTHVLLHRSRFPILRNQKAQRQGSIKG